MTALVPHQHGLGLNPGVEAICGLNFLLVLSLAARGFSPSSPVFPFLETLPNPNSIWNARTCFNEFLRTPKCSMGKQITKLQKKVRNIAFTGLLKVAGSRRNSPPTWLVLARYSALRFFTDGVFSNIISLDWPLTLTTQLSILKLSDNPCLWQLTHLVKTRQGY